MTLIDCPALHSRSVHWPARFGNHVPKIVRMLMSVRPDGLVLMVDATSRDLIAEDGKCYPAWTNSHGAVCAVFPDGRHLGLKPDEFEIVEWHEISKQPTT